MIPHVSRPYKVRARDDTPVEAILVRRSKPHGTLEPENVTTQTCTPWTSRSVQVTLGCHAMNASMKHPEDSTPLESRQHATSPESRILIEFGDITTYATDAIVNAANRELLRGGGVDGAIHRSAGPELQRACNALGGCDVGQAKATPGFKLPCRYVIHAVGPEWVDGTHQEVELLASCYRSALGQATALELTSIAFPAISCGVFGFPIELACKTAYREVVDFLEGNDAIQRVYFVCFGSTVFESLEAVRDSLRLNRQAGV